jgi:hypothetical protein
MGFWLVCLPCGSSVLLSMYKDFSIDYVSSAFEDFFIQGTGSCLWVRGLKKGLTIKRLFYTNV